MRVQEQQISQEAAAIFVRAAAYIRTYGWQEKGMSEHGLPRCSMGALQSAWPDATSSKDLPALMYDTLYDELDGISLSEFNAREQNGEAVAQLFEKVAASLTATTAQS